MKYLLESIDSFFLVFVIGLVLVYMGSYISGMYYNLAVTLAMEVLFTFALTRVVLNAATHKKTEVNSFYSLDLSFTLLAAFGKFLSRKYI